MQAAQEQLGAAELAVSEAEAESRAAMQRSVAHLSSDEQSALEGAQAAAQELERLVEGLLTDKAAAEAQAQQCEAKLAALSKPAVIEALRARVQSSAEEAERCKRRLAEAQVGARPCMQHGPDTCRSLLYAQAMLKAMVMDCVCAT